MWTFFIYDAFGKKVAEYGGLQATDEGGVKYVLQDFQGSTRAIVGNNGYVQARMDYTAFGTEIQSNIGQRTGAGYAASSSLSEKYALTERDKATGLDHTWFRKLEQQAGRWTSPDPYNGSMSIGNPQSFNRYSYVDNQPTNFVDPSGLQLRSFDVSRGMGCVLEADGKFHCTEYIDRYWYDDGIGNGEGSGGSFGGGGGAQQQQPKIDDQKLKDCIKNLFKLDTNSYKVGVSYEGNNGFTYGFFDIFTAFFDSIFGVDRSLVSVSTTKVDNNTLRVKTGAYLNPLASQNVVYGYTETNGKTNMISNDTGTPEFQDAMWVYELGNALGIQTGNHPLAKDEGRRYGNEGGNDKGGPALMDCVYDGKVNSNGKISPIPK